MAIGRMDTVVQDAQGRALSGATVYYCNQPATTSTNPPSPLATAYSDPAGDPGSNPQITDGFGHVAVYLIDSLIYTIVAYHPLFGPNPMIYPDQAVPGGGTGVGYTPFAEVPAGAVDGTNTVFTLTVEPTQLIFWVNYPVVPGVGYTLSGSTITTASPPQPAANGRPADIVYASGLY